MKNQKQIERKLRDTDKKLDTIGKKIDKLLLNRSRENFELRYEELQEDWKFYYDVKSTLTWVLYDGVK